jgi:hypothetical protein
MIVLKSFIVKSEVSKFQALLSFAVSGFQNNVNSLLSFFKVEVPGSKLEVSWKLATRKVLSLFSITEAAERFSSYLSPSKGKGRKRFTPEDLAISKLMDSLGSNTELNLWIDQQFKKSGVKSLNEAKVLDR